MPLSESGFTRRRFLQTLPILAGAVLVSCRPGQGDASTGTWVPLGNISSFPKGSIKRVTLPPAQNGEVIYVNHQANDQLLALWARCTHRGCTVDWDQPDKKFVCPCHRGQFDATGKVLAGPPQMPLNILATKVDKSGNVSVQAPQMAPRQG